MPMITVCPRLPNERNLLLGLMREYPDYVLESIKPRLDKHLRKRLLDEEIAHRLEVGSANSMKRVTEYVRQCWTDDWQMVVANGTLDESCHLVHLLLVLYMAETSSYGLEATPFLHKQIMSDNHNLQLSDLESYLKIVLGVESIGSFIDELAPISNHLYTIAYMYNMFFYLPKEDDPMELGRISDFAFPDPGVSNLDVNGLSSLLVNLADWSYFEAKECSDNTPSFIRGVLIEMMAKHLRINATEPVHLVFNYFSYNVDVMEALKPLEAHEKFPCLGLTEKKADSFSFAEVCRMASGVDAACKNYCDLITRPLLGEKIKGLYHMAMDGHSLNGKGNYMYYTLLPFCLSSGGRVETECWREVTTEFGICFSTLSGMVHTYTTLLSS